ncbi:ATP-dependent microtubule motor [Aureococcus anophagefferens]|nr:ATP-dependent microtubule motor [Aureococcus anophagefferens]
MTEDAGGQNLTVAVRLRPLNKREEQKKVAKVVRSSQNRVVVSAGARGGPDRTYNYDKVFSPYATQEHVFDSLVSPVVDEVLAGFNCTVFAYGPTGTGKTHTMEGSLEEPAEMGLIPRCARALYERLERRDADFQVKASCLEVYNEELSDLLDEAAGAARPSSGGGGGSAAMAAATAKPGAGKRALRLVQTAGEGAVTCANLEEVACGTLDDCVQVLRRGSRARHTAATLCNDKSSRSHAIYTLKVCVRTLTEDGRDLVVNGQLNLVDLAGSECVGRSGATAGRAREAGSINQSLLSLGRVIAALVSGGDSKYVPYRDSKLTRLLQDSLGGRAKTTLIATVSPGRDASDETLSTLQYALRARSITNKPEQHARYHGKALVKAHAKEVDDLQRLLAAQRDKQGGVLVPADQWDDMQNLLANKKAELEELGEALAESREARVAAEKAYDDERERADDERIKREAAEERLAARSASATTPRPRSRPRRGPTRRRAPSSARAAAEARLLDDGAKLKGAVTGGAADLDAASTRAWALEAALAALRAAEAAATRGAGVRDGALATCVAGFSAAVAALVGDVRAAAAADADASAAQGRVGRAAAARRR